MVASRALTIARVCWRHRLDTLLKPEWLEAIDAPRRWRWLLRLNPLRLSTPKTDEGTRLRQALTELGPVYIKLGQLLSTRRDIVPPALADELAKLQDSVPPMDNRIALGIISEELGQPIDEAFATLDEQPLASASIAQVHTGTLPTGEAIVVKVVRPGLRDAIDADLNLLRRIVSRLEGGQATKRLRLAEVLNDYERTITAELSMRAEAANQSQLRANFANSETLYVPKVYQALSTDRILTMERIYGVPVSHVEELERVGVDVALLAERGVATFFKQVFDDNFFHADMHPGNVYVDVSEPANPKYIALDCAIIGSLDARDRDYLARNLLAFFNRDYEEVARLHVHSGWIGAHVSVDEFAEVIREVCDPIFAKPLAEISFGEFLVNLFQTAARFEMEVQPQLILLQKTLLYIEGLGRMLYPQLDLWQTGQPFIERWVLEQEGPAAQIKRVTDKAPALLKLLPELPDLLLGAQTTLADLRRTQAQQQMAIEALQSRAASKRRQRIGGVALLVAAAALLWQPLTAVFTSPAEADWLARLGVLSAIAGTTLLIRA